MAKKTNVALQVGVDIDLLLSNINDKNLFATAKAHLDQLAANLKGAKAIPLEMKLDIGPAAKEFKKAMAQLRKDFAGPLRTLGANLGEGNIAAELSKRLKEAGETALKDGKKLEAILQQIAKEVGIKGTVSARGKNPLKEYLSLTGSTLADATTALEAKSKGYEAAINKLVTAQETLAAGATKKYTAGVKAAQTLEQKAHQRTMNDAQKKLEELQARIAGAKQFVKGAGDPGSQKQVEYSQARTKGSGASAKDLEGTATAFKRELVGTRAKLEKLKGSDLAGFIDEGAIDAKIKVLSERILKLNSEISNLTGNYKHAEEGASLVTKQIRSLTEALEKQSAEARRASVVVNKTGETGDIEKQVSALKKLADTYRVLAEITGDTKFATKGDRVDRVIAGLEKELKLRKENLQIQEKIDAAQTGERDLGIIRKYAQGRDLLKAIQSQAELTQRALVAMDEVGFNPTELKVYQDKLIALRAEAEALKLSLKQASKSKPADLETAKGRVDVTGAKVSAEQERYAQFSGDSSSRERLGMLQAQKKAVEDYITALQHLHAAEATAGKDSGVNAKLAEQRELLRDLEGQLKGFDNVMVQLGRAFQNFLRYAVLYQLFYQITNAVKSVVGEIFNLQDALTQIKAITLATEDQMRSVEDAIKSVAETTAFTTDEIAKGGQTLVQAGVKTQDFAKVLRATANLASATGSSFEKGAEVITTFMNVFERVDPETIADKLTNAVNISKLNIQDLTSIANYLLSTSESFNISLDNTLAAATTLRNAGFKASTIATGTRQAILELLSPDAKTLKALQGRYAKLGISMTQEAIAAMFTGFRDAKNPMVAALNELEKLGFGGLGDKELSRVFEVRSESVIRALVQNKDELLANEVALQRAGTAAQGAQIRLESLKNSFQNLGEAIVTVIYNQTKGLVGWLKDVVDLTAKAVEGFKDMSIQLQSATGETGAGTSMITGAAASIAALASRASLSSIAGAGIVAAVIQEFVQLLGGGNKAVQSFSKAVERAAIALAVTTSVASLGNAKGGFSLGAIVATLVRAVSSKAVWVAAAIAFATAIGDMKEQLLRYFLGDKAPKDVPSPDKLQAMTEASSLRQQADREKRIKSQEEVASSQQNVKQLKDYQEKLNTSDFSLGVKGTKTEKVASLMQQAADGVVALGSQSLEALIAKLSEASGIAKEQIDRSEVATKLQELNGLTQQGEAMRKQYIEKLIKAYSDMGSDQTSEEGRKTATAFVKAFEALSLEEQGLLRGQVSSYEGAKQMATALKKVTPLLEENAISMADMRESLEQMSADFAIARGGTKDQAQKALARVNAKVAQAMEDGQVSLILAIFDTFAKEGYTKAYMEQVIAATKANALAKAKTKYEANVRKAELALPAEPKNIPDAEAFQARFEGDSEARRKKSGTKGVVGEGLKADLETKNKEYIALNKQMLAAQEGGATVEEKKKLDEAILAKESEILNLSDTLAKLTGESVNTEDKIQGLKRSFYAGEQEIKRLEDELKIVHGAKLADTKREASITKQIYGLKSKQLAQEEQVLSDSLKQEIDKAGLFQTKGLSTPDLMKALGGSAGSEAMKNNKDLADKYKALADVVNEESLLREKLTTDLDNIYRKELEAKQKTAKKDYDAATKKVDTLKGKLQTSQDKLASAQEKLANAYEKRAEIEQTFADLEAEVTGKKKTRSDLEAQLQTAANTGSVQIATQTAQEAKGLMGQGLSKSDTLDLIDAAKQVALSIQDQQIGQDQYAVNRAQYEVNQNTLALQDATRTQNALKASLDTLNSQIEKLGGNVGAEVAATDQAAQSTPVSGLSERAQTMLAVGRAKGADYLSQNLGYAEGGPIRGPGSTTSDSIPIRASVGEFMQPAKAVAMYGQDFMDKLRNLQISPAMARAVAVSAKPLGGSSAREQQQLQPVLFQVGNDMISAKAQPDAVAQFQAALRLQAVKNGRRA